MTSISAKSTVEQFILDEDAFAIFLKHTDGIPIVMDEEDVKAIAFAGFTDKIIISPQTRALIVKIHSIIGTKDLFVTDGWNLVYEEPADFVVLTHDTYQVFKLWCILEGITSVARGFHEWILLALKADKASGDNSLDSRVEMLLKAFEKRERPKNKHTEEVLAKLNLKTNEVVLEENSEGTVKPNSEVTSKWSQ